MLDHNPENGLVEFNKKENKRRNGFRNKQCKYLFLPQRKPGQDCWKNQIKILKNKIIDKFGFVQKALKHFFDDPK